MMNLKKKKNLKKFHDPGVLRGGKAGLFLTGPGAQGDPGVPQGGPGSTPGGSQGVPQMGPQGGS
jgi:hypothetical protein